MPKPWVHRVREVVCQPVLGVLIQDAWFSRLVLLMTVTLVAASAAGIDVWPCPFMKVTRYPCPGCGLTRSVRALLRGDVAASMAYNAFGVVALSTLLLIAIAAVLPSNLRHAFSNRICRVERRTGCFIVLFALLLLYWAARLLFANAEVLQLLRKS